VDMLEVVVVLLLKMWNWVLSAVGISERYLSDVLYPPDEIKIGLLWHISWKIFILKWWI